MSESFFSKHKMLVTPMKESKGAVVDEEVKRIVDHFYDENQFMAMMEFKSLRQKISLIASNAVKEDKIVEKLSLDILYKYYDQLCALEMRSSPTAFENLRDEKMRALFNIGAFCSSLADSQDCSTEFGFQFANQLLEQSAGIFACLSPFADVDGVSNLDTDALQALSILVLAQAQELFVLKAIEEISKSSYIAMLAYSCKELFSGARQLIQNSILSSRDTDLVQKVTGKEAELYATAEYHQSIVCYESTEETVRLYHASDLFGTAETKLGKSKLYTKFGSEIYIKLADLNSLRSELDVSLFDEPTKKQVVKVIPFDRKLSSSFNDLFDTMVSDHTKYAKMNDNVALIDEIFDVELKKLHDTDGLLAKNSSVDLAEKVPKIDVCQHDALLQSILAMANYIRNQGGVESLRKKMVESTEILNKTKEVWINCDYLLNKENKDDTRLRKQFKAKWTLTPFDELCETLRATAGKYREFIRKAKLADKTARNAFSKHVTAMEHLQLVGCAATVDGEIAERMQENRDITDLPESEQQLIQRASTEMNGNNAHTDIASDDKLTDSNLEEAYDCYKILEIDMECANTFYNNLSQLLDDFQKQVSDLCSTRKAEKEALLWSLAA
ncbi:apoptosis-linked gene 2-interacting protein X 1-like [Sitodiplosis mosellana]|uniref:apoptosis-linked gene 2-interacting protein X 1-like n=1 Tax=Sitodiplosis mosellana TaxID=263140 RepID=UPI0024441C64|nr:apoptosis-linked gene 2-interacting protein X 1-like [Sitodiplosis mosellana]